MHKKTRPFLSFCCKRLHQCSREQRILTGLFRSRYIKVNQCERRDSEARTNHRGEQDFLYVWYCLSRPSRQKPVFTKIPSNDTSNVVFPVFNRTPDVSASATTLLLIVSDSVPRRLDHILYTESCVKHVCAK